MTQADQLLASLAVLRRQWRRRILLEALAWVALAAVIGLVAGFAISRVIVEPSGRGSWRSASLALRTDRRRAGALPRRSARAAHERPAVRAVRRGARAGAEAVAPLGRARAARARERALVARRSTARLIDADGERAASAAERTAASSGRASCARCASSAAAVAAARCSCCSGPTACATRRGRCSSPGPPPKRRRR